LRKGCGTAPSDSTQLTSDILLARDLRTLSAGKNDLKMIDLPKGSDKDIEHQPQIRSSIIGNRLEIEICSVEQV
jgi:hypothetical protein